MNEYTVYEPGSGRIVRHGQCAPGDFALQTDPGEALLPLAWSDADYYVVNGAPVRRPHAFARDEYALAPGEELRIEGLPATAVLVVNGAERHALTDGVLEFSSAVPGTFYLILRAFPFREDQVRVIVA